LVVVHDPLPRRRFLDPRGSAHPPIRDAVHIPLDELDRRVHELPPLHEPVLVAAEHSLGEAVAARLKRPVEIVPFELGEPEPQGRLWEPNALLQGLSAPPGRALDLGCGTGRDAVYLAAAGWEVRAIDHLPDALERGRFSAERILGQPSIEWICADLESVSASEKFNLVCAFFIFSSAVLDFALASLSPGGTLLIEAFTPTHRAERGKPKNLDRTLDIARAHQLPGVTVLSAEEGWRSDRHSLRLVAVKS